MFQPGLDVDIDVGICGDLAPAERGRQCSLVEHDGRALSRGVEIGIHMDRRLQQAHLRTEVKNIEETNVQLPTCADKVALPAITRRCCCAPSSNQSISLPARPAASNLQQRLCCCGPMLEQPDRQTDRRTP